MSQPRVNPSPDIVRLINEGYEVEIRGAYLLISHVPYVNSARAVCYGTLVSTLTLNGNVISKPDNHVVQFAGEHPCHRDGSIMREIQHASSTTTLADGIVVNHSFSNKPPGGYADYYEKMSRYADVISAPARAIDPTAKAKTFRVIESKPDASVFNLEGEAVQLRALLEGHASLLVFYRGGWCPYCNFQIHELVENAAAFEKRGVGLVAVSVDKVDEASRTTATYTIPFPVLSDPDLVMHRAFKVVHQADAAEAAKLKSFGLAIERASGKSHHAFAVPSVFIIGKDGLIRWAHVDPDYKVRPSAEQLLTVLDSLGPLP